MTHEIRQGEGGEQGDAMIPLLYALGQHQALRSVQSQLRPSEGLLAFLDDICVVTSLERTCEVHTILREALWDNSRIQIHVGKTQIWNRAGVVPRDFAMDLAYTCVKHQRRSYVCQGLAHPKHQMRLYVCHQMRLIRVSPNALIRVSPNALIRVSPNASTESATELASLACFCSLRSHVF